MTNIKEALAVVGLSAGIVMAVYGLAFLQISGVYSIVDKICTIVCKICTVCK